MFDWYDRVQWGEISALLNSGHPSILQQLIVVNTLSLVAIVFMRLWHRNVIRKRPKYFVQEFLLIANMFILSENQLAALLSNTIIPMIYKFRQYAS